MSKFYHVIREGEQRWIRKPNNGGECCTTQEDTVEELNRLIQERDALKARVKRLEDALVSIQEYWNRDNNEGAMQDACWHAINTAIDALEAKESKP